LALVATLAAAAPAHAASCTISTTAVSFGTYNVFTTASLDSAGSVTYTCSGNASVTIALNKGLAATFNPRTMRKGSEALNYNLYRDATRTTIWGDGTGGTTVYSNASVPNSTPVTVTIYGRVPAQQDISAGSYSDTITATINF
jgi:spore coat protein U-like protein